MIGLAQRGMRTCESTDRSTRGLDRSKSLGWGLTVVRPISRVVRRAWQSRRIVPRWSGCTWFAPLTSPATEWLGTIRWRASGVAPYMTGSTGGVEGSGLVRTLALTRYDVAQPTFRQSRSDQPCQNSFDFYLRLAREMLETYTNIEESVPSRCSCRSRARPTLARRSGGYALC
jgi:hypothetical protein